MNLPLSLSGLKVFLLHPLRYINSTPGFQSTSFLQFGEEYFHLKTRCVHLSSCHISTHKQCLGLRYFSPPRIERNHPRLAFAAATDLLFSYSTGLPPCLMSSKVADVKNSPTYTCLSFHRIVGEKLPPLPILFKLRNTYSSLSDGLVHLSVRKGL